MRAARPEAVSHPDRVEMVVPAGRVLAERTALLIRKGARHLRSDMNLEADTDGPNNGAVDRPCRPLTSTTQ